MTRGAHVFFYLVILTLVTFNACSSDRDGGGGGRSSGSGETMAVGFVLDTIGAPVSHAHVITADQHEITDSNGRFTLPIDPNEITVLTVEAGGRVPVYRRIEPNPGATVAIWVTVFDPVTEMIDVRDAAQTIDIGGGAALLTFPQGSIVLEDSGAEPEGSVSATVTWYDPSQYTSLVQPPTPMLGTDGSQTGELVSHGMVEVQLSYQGQPCNIASGMTATLEIYSRSDDPSEAGLFLFDPERGLWVQEGLATNDGYVWTAEVPHFTWINIDHFYKLSPSQCACMRFYTHTPPATRCRGCSSTPAGC